MLPPGRPKALAPPRGERRVATLGGNMLPPGRPKALAPPPTGERRAATLGENR